MKTIYIPKGETVCYENLVTDHIVVKGCLKVLQDIKAKSITGGGVIYAGSVSADSIHVDELESASVTCRCLLAKRVQTPQLIASESAAVSCYLAASYVETGKLTVAASEICEAKFEEVVHLTPKKRSLFGLLLVSALLSLWTSLTAPAAQSKPLDAAWKPVEEPSEKPVEPVEDASEPKDEELARFVAMFRMLRESNYTLKIIPGTPEENAPQFDFTSGRITRSAADHYGEAA